MPGGAPQPPVSPWVWTAGDYQGNTITATVAFNNSTLALTSCTMVRQAGCVYAHVYFGLGANGTPDTTPSQFGPVATGTTVANAAQLAAFGFTSMNQILAGQITAGP